MTSSVATALPTGTWAIDPVHSSINFSVRHLVVSKVRGGFDDFSGTITVADDGTPSVAAEIAVDSVNTRNEQRDAHLRAADFFDVENHPVATFASTSVREAGERYVLDGELRTPTLASGCLAGITRALIVEWCGAVEIDEPIEVLEEATEIFLASTTRDVQAVSQCDARTLPAPGPVTEAAARTWAIREAENPDP